MLFAVRRSRIIPGFIHVRMFAILTLHFKLVIKGRYLLVSDTAFIAQRLLNDFVQAHQKRILVIAHIAYLHAQRAVRVFMPVADSGIAVLVVRDGFDDDFHR